MKVEVGEGNEIVLKELYCGVVLKTDEGNQLSVCARDDTFEFRCVPHGETIGVWYRFNMQTRMIEKL
jgi:hypothetical protein